MRVDHVELRITKDEALVLFEFLSRFGSTDELSLQDQSEERALWNLLGILEKSLTEPFDSEYAALLAAARNRIRDGQ